MTTTGLAVFALSAGSATAATIHAQGVYRVDINEIDYVASPGEANRVVLGQDGDLARLDDPGALIVSTDLPAASSYYCLTAATTARCAGPSQWFEVVASLGDGDDSLALTPGQQKIAYGSADGGPGNDRLHADGWSLTGGPGADDLGGAGAAVHYDTAAGPVHVSLDDVAGDGAAGEGDNVHSDVRSVFGGPFDDVIDVRGAGQNYVSCGTGTDTVLADAQDTVSSDCEQVTTG